MNITESEMPVICISAASVNEDWQKYQKAGMNTFLPKPFTEEVLLTTLLSVVKDYGPVNRVEQTLGEKTDSSVNDKINLDNLYHISGGDEQFVKQMLVSFIDSTRKGLEEIREAVKTGQFETVAELAHKMLPPSRHIGASELCDLLKKIEINIRRKEEPQLLGKLSEDAMNEFDAVSILITEQIAKIS
jgi:HPt (histidine-containing phosphotransfer) domain-containing protein